MNDKFSTLTEEEKLKSEYLKTSLRRHQRGKNFPLTIVSELLATLPPKTQLGPYLNCLLACLRKALYVYTHRCCETHEVAPVTQPDRRRSSPAGPPLH